MPSIQNSELLGAVADALYERLAGSPETDEGADLRRQVRVWVDECESRGGELWETELGPLLERLERRLLAERRGRGRPNPALPRAGPCRARASKPGRELQRESEQ
jgi:hypothetical protein